MKYNLLSSAVSNKITVQQLFNRLCISIAEHKWNDAMTILPAVVTQIKDRYHVQFIWKAVHLIMIHKNISQEDQVKILLIMFQSKLKQYEAALDWLTESLSYTDISNLETVRQFVKMKSKGADSSRYSIALFDAYIGLYYYLDWKKKYNEFGILGEGSCSIDQSNQKDQGLKTLDLLTKSLLCLGTSHVFDEEDCKSEVSGPQYSNSKRRELMCEWLLAPIIDLETKLSENQDCQERIRRRYGLNSLSNIEVMEKYVNDHQYHLPALKFYYQYILEYHPEEETRKLEVLEKICLLCPDEFLILEYVELVLQTGKATSLENPDEELSLIKRENVNIKSSNCILQGENIPKVIECVSLVTNFVEHSHWQKCNRAWEILKSILRKLQIAWMNCWNCINCTSSRESLRKLAEKLTLWPVLFWDIPNSADFLTEDNLKLLMLQSYSAFMFCYDNGVINKLDFLLQDYKSLRKEFKSLLKIKGQNSEHFEAYRVEHQSPRFQNREIIPHFSKEMIKQITVPGMQVNYIPRPHELKLDKDLGMSKILQATKKKISAGKRNSNQPPKKKIKLNLIA